MRLLGPAVLLAALVACAGGQKRPEDPLEEPLGLQADAGEALLTRSRGVGADVQDARTALAGGDGAGAQAHLDSAASALSEMRRVLPGAALLRDLDDVGVRLAPGERAKVDLGPLATRVDAEALFLDPDVVRSIAEARNQLGDGQRTRAFELLGEARQRLADDIGVPLVDDANRRLAEAENALKKGHMEQALELLATVGAAIDQVGLRAPLVPVRFDLRAAAATAELGNWDRARRFVDRAASRLESLRGMATGPEVPALLEETHRLQRAIDERRLPRTADLRWLAGRTRLSRS